MTLAGHVRGFLGKRPEEARALHDRAIALNPNLALAWCFSGLAHSYLGDHAEATRRIKQAQRLSPHDPHGFFFDTAQIMPNLLLRDYDAAITAGRRAIVLNPGFSSSLKAQLAALGHLGREQEAAEVRGRLLTLEPEFSIKAAPRGPPWSEVKTLRSMPTGYAAPGCQNEVHAAGLVWLQTIRPGVYVVRQRSGKSCWRMPRVRLPCRHYTACGGLLALLAMTAHRPGSKRQDH